MARVWHNIGRERHLRKLMPDTPCPHYSFRAGRIHGIGGSHQTSGQQRTDLIQIGRIELRKIHQMIVVLKADKSIANVTSRFSRSCRKTRFT